MSIPADTYHIKVSTNGSQYLRDHFWEANTIVDLGLLDAADYDINVKGGNSVQLNLTFPENIENITYYFAAIVSIIIKFQFQIFLPHF